MIAGPLESVLADRIRSLAVVGELLYDEALLPKPRYINDHAGVPFVRDAAAESRWNAMLERADVLFGYPGDSGAGLAAALARAPHVRFVQGTAAGAGGHVKAAALSADVLQRVRFCTAAGAHGGMLAEFAFYGLLALRKDARRLQRLRDERSWEHFAMGELDGSRISIVGMGQIGCAVALRARAFGMHVIAVNRTGEVHALGDETVAAASLSDILPSSDAVVVTLPLTDKTQHLIDAKAIAALPAHGILINVGRGPVVDNDALVAALEQNRIAGAVLDVFDPEPLPPDNPLWTLPNVIFAPHTAALSVHENQRIVDIFCDNLQRLAADRPLRNVVNLAEFY